MGADDIKNNPFLIKRGRIQISKEYSILPAPIFAAYSRCILGSIPHTSVIECIHPLQLFFLLIRSRLALSMATGSIEASIPTFPAKTGAEKLKQSHPGVRSNIQLIYPIFPGSSLSGPRAASPRQACISVV
jgi:hypothetical protein